MHDAEIDGLLTSEWTKLEELDSLLEPFASLTDLLQSDSQTLSHVIPALLDLECHLQQHRAPKALLENMRKDLRRRFESILDPFADGFNPLPAAACLLDPSFCKVMLIPEMASLLHAAKMFVVASCEEQTVEVLVPALSGSSSQPGQSVTATQSSALSRFKYLSIKLRDDANTPTGSSCNSVLGQLNRYISESCDEDRSSVSGLEYWAGRKSSYSTIYEIAQDLLSSPASQAYVERIFSLCGMLTLGRRNRLEKSLEMRVFLKLNREDH